MADEITVKGGELPVDPDRVFNRTARLLHTDVKKPEVIKIVKPHSQPGWASQAIPDPIARLGVVPSGTTVRGSAVPGFTGLAPSSDTVLLNQSVVENATVTELVLVHEFVHTIQWASGSVFLPQRIEEISGPGPRMVRAATIEGAATYVMDVYRRRYLENKPSVMLHRLQAVYERGTPVLQYLVADYIFGKRYIADRFASPKSLWRAYSYPPQTTEVIIHRYAPDAEPKVPLRITGTGSEWRPTGPPKRIGELATRIVLGTAMNDSMAAKAAAGWGNDRLLQFRHGPARGYAWVLRWDDAANASEFRQAFKLYLSVRASRTDSTWRTGNGTAFRLLVTGDRTTVVLYGSPEFVERASVSGQTKVVVTTS